MNKVGIDERHYCRLIFDDRWKGRHGIGRMAAEIGNRLSQNMTFESPRYPAAPISPFDPLVQGVELALKQKRIFYSPGFNPPLLCQHRAVFTVCDLIHLHVPGEAGALKRLYYERIVRPAVSRVHRVLTISEYSRRDLLEWSGASESQIVNIGCGVDERFFSVCELKDLGFPYLLSVGYRKPHKNLDRLLEAFSRSKASRELKLVMSGAPDNALIARAKQLGIEGQLVFVGYIPESEMPAYYRGATALLFPSCFEGFGLPPLEAMAGGTPALTSNVTSLPESVGTSALMVDPFSTEALCDGIDRLVFDEILRADLRVAGPKQARKHSWDDVVSKVRVVLSDLQSLVEKK